MIYLVVFLLLVIVWQCRHIFYLRREIRTHENNWVESEEITDHNKDGDVVIHCRHTKDK